MSLSGKKGRIILTLILGACSRAHAEPSAVGVPVCNGYNPETNAWGDVGSLTDGDNLCPTGYAIMSFAFYGGGAESPAQVRANGTCCKLPDGVLTDSHQFAFADCPEDYVATGTRVQETGTGRGIGIHSLRCTKIDTTRYKLANVRPGVRMGMAIEYLGQMWERLKGGNTELIPRSSVPIAFRYALLRRSFSEWAYNGCLGYPFGSLLVGKHTKRCSGTRFKQLLDRTTNNPIQIFPPCKRIDDPFAKVTRCIE